jgi:hypothetical protein
MLTSLIVMFTIGYLDPSSPVAPGGQDLLVGVISGRRAIFVVMRLLLLQDHRGTRPMNPVTKEHIDQMREIIHEVLAGKASKIFLGRIDDH